MGRDTFFPPREISQLQSPQALALVFHNTDTFYLPPPLVLTFSVVRKVFTIVNKNK